MHTTPHQRGRPALTAWLISQLPLALLVLLALALRLLVWGWHTHYPLGGDETEYLDQARTLLQTRQYVELRLMRPPLYTIWLAGCIVLFDSLVERLRLVQALISALTVVPLYALAWQLFRSRPVALLSAGLAALNYTLAAHASELLTETLFLGGLSVCLWLLVWCGTSIVQADPSQPQRSAFSTKSTKATKREHAPAPSLQPPASGGATSPSPTSLKPLASSLRLTSLKPLASSLTLGLFLGALALLRSVALPLVPLGALYLLLAGHAAQRKRAAGAALALRRLLQPALLLVLGAVLVIAPWTTRNYLRYGSAILIDTTGAENLWLDNNPQEASADDPLGREAAKRQLYALGDDRAARQQLALNRGSQAILSHPAWFAAKAWGEAQRFFALQYFDDMRDRRAIWVPPAEVTLRLVLGDGLWLLGLLAGASGLWLAPRQPADPRWLLVPWSLYTLLTGLLFHVELRYRLPLYPVLLPYAAWTLVATAGWARARLRRHTGMQPRRRPWWAALGSLLTGLLLVAMTLLHRPYLAEASRLVAKHTALWQAEQALAQGDAPAARAAALRALTHDPASALAQVAQARAALLGRDWTGAGAALDAAIAALPAHPYGHLLRGALLRAQGQPAAARAELERYETASLEDLQTWAWHSFAPLQTPTPALELGGGLDLGLITGFHAREEPGFRWSTAEARVLLAAPPGAQANATLRITLAPGRPTGAPRPSIDLLVNGRAIGRLAPQDGWQTYTLPLPLSAGPQIVTLRSDTFRPRDYDRASPDGRALGVQVRQIELVTP